MDKSSRATRTLAFYRAEFPACFDSVSPYTGRFPSDEIASAATTGGSRGLATTRITSEQRQAVLNLLAQGHDRDTIAAMTGVTPGQVSAVSAHVKMGTYELPSLTTRETTSRTSVLLNGLRGEGSDRATFSPILLGKNVETGDLVKWNPDASTGTANPHVLILGESGFGKTYAVTCLLAELAQRGVRSIVFDYAQGFTKSTLPKEFQSWCHPVELNASRDGIDLNPLEIFPSDIHGPVNVAQRVADTFGRVYSRLGVQQHAVLRQAVLDVFSAKGIVANDPKTWRRRLPPFRSVYDRLVAIGDTPGNRQSGVATNVASHISTMFVFDTFRAGGLECAWAKLLDSTSPVHVFQLRGLEFSLERAVTEFLLWNFIGFIEATGPGELRCFIVLDEAHRLSFDEGSPVEKLLREGRKYGLGLILASQQPDDFSDVAFGNTATKLVFQIADDKSLVSRRLHRKMRSGHAFADLFTLITKLPRGHAYVVTENEGRVVSISPFKERRQRKAQ